MDEAQATEIRDHLLDVDYTLLEAIAAVSHLLQPDKQALTGPLEKLLKGLHGKSAAPDQRSASAIRPAVDRHFHYLL
jgi:hypothetical protein